MDAFRVIAVSRPGYLGTPFGEARTPEQQADLYAALFDRLGISTALVIAVSAGGPSALQFALRHPSRCAGLILVSACSGRLDIPPEVAVRLPVMKLMARLPWLTGLMRWLSSRSPSRRASRSIRDEAVLNRTLAHPQAGPLMHALQASTKSRLAQRLPGMLNDIAQFAAMPPMPLSQVRAPTLVMHGTGDRAVPFVHGKRVADEVPHAGLMAVDGGEHVAIFTHLDDIRARVCLFVERLARPAGLS
jgi:pimeloyl-ACP methyl ester carboxylesterase